MKFQVIDTSTLAGMKKVKFLLRKGWFIERSGLFLVWLRRS